MRSVILALVLFAALAGAAPGAAATTTSDPSSSTHASPTRAAQARPILKSVIVHLQGLGQPGAATARWRALLAARSQQLALMDQQDTALPADVRLSSGR